MVHVSSQALVLGSFALAHTMKLSKEWKKA
jgi:hypothetical protein